MPDIVGGYTYLTGRTPLPQLWTLGYHQSRWGYDSADCIKKVAGKYRELDIPCDTMHFDIDYMDGYRVFTWNEKDYGDPAETIQELADEGFKAVCIIDPGVKLDPGYEKYDEGIAGDYFAKTPEGEVYVNAVWLGDSVYPDFGQPKVRKWWAENQKFLTDIGVAGVWNDMNEPASFHGELPSDVVFTDEDQKSTHAAMHNVYGHLMSKATYEGLKEQTGKRPFVITRACYAGSQKYTTVWTGDNQSLWSHLQMAVPQLCNLGLSGLAFAGTDVGGFGADCTAELLCRWVQVGAFSPLFRNHSSNGSIYQEPWQFGEKTVNIYRKFVELRYRLLPYLYDLFAECEKTGLPIMRPLVLHYEKDENTWNLNDEFLVGEHLLVAPVLEQGQTKKMVYLPEGIWYDFNTGKRYEGKQYYLVDAPLDTCPMFAKAGSMIPTYEVMQYVGEKPYDTLNMLVFPGEGTYVHYQDNGSDFAYQDGAYNEYAFTQQENGEVTMKMMKEGYERPYKKIEYIFVGK
ncbi:MAG: TIM-barrel domain-containing protein [Roseburia inulinivorans]